MKEGVSARVTHAVLVVFVAALALLAVALVVLAGAGGDPRTFCDGPHRVFVSATGDLDVIMHDARCPQPSPWTGAGTGEGR